MSSIDPCNAGVMRSALGAIGLVLLALAAPAETAGAAQSAQTGQADIVDTLAAESRFHTFVDAVGVTGLADVLKGPGPFTVWAPIDAAFDKLPPGMLAQLLNNPTMLRSVISYHVANGEVTAAQVVQVPSVQTLQGSSVRISTAAGAVLINQAAVIQPDVMARNGIIHVVDGVLLPPTLAARVQIPARAPTALPRTGEGDVSATAALLVGAALLVAGMIMRLLPRVAR